MRGALRLCHGAPRTPPPRGRRARAHLCRVGDGVPVPAGEGVLPAADARQDLLGGVVGPVGERGEPARGGRGDELPPYNLKQSPHGHCLFVVKNSFSFPIVLRIQDSWTKNLLLNLFSRLGQSWGSTGQVKKGTAPRHPGDRGRSGWLVLRFPRKRRKILWLRAERRGLRDPG